MADCRRSSRRGWRHMTKCRPPSRYMIDQKWPQALHNLASHRLFRGAHYPWLNWPIRNLSAWYCGPYQGADSLASSHDGPSCGGASTRWQRWSAKRCVGLHFQRAKWQKNWYNINYGLSMMTSKSATFNGSKEMLIRNLMQAARVWQWQSSKMLIMKMMFCLKFDFVRRDLPFLCAEWGRTTLPSLRTLAQWKCHCSYR